MTDTHWAVFALQDLKKALDKNRYDVAIFHIDDAISAIIARDDQDAETEGARMSDSSNGYSNRL